MEQWTPTRDVREAAAFGTIGMPVRVKKTLVARTGTVEVDFFLGLTNVEGTESTKQIQAAYRKGTLSPTHPYLTIQRCFSNRSAILDLQEKGRRIRLIETRTPGIFRFVDGDSALPGVPAGVRVIETGDLKMAAALATVGYELLRVEGPRGKRKYTLRRDVPQADGPPTDGVELVRAWRADKSALPWEEPFAQAARGLHNRERVLDAARREAALVLLQKPRSPRHRSALIREDATDAAFEEVEEFFDQE